MRPRPRVSDIDKRAHPKFLPWHTIDSNTRVLGRVRITRLWVGWDELTRAERETR